MLDYPPESRVHQKSDMWSVGVMTWKIVSDTVSLDQLNESRFVVKERFKPYSSYLYEFVSKCVVKEPDERLSIDEGIRKVGIKDLTRDLPLIVLEKYV